MAYQEPTAGTRVYTESGNVATVNSAGYANEPRDDKQAGSGGILGGLLGHKHHEATPTTTAGIAPGYETSSTATRPVVMAAPLDATIPVPASGTTTAPAGHHHGHHHHHHDAQRGYGGMTSEGYTPAATATTITPPPGETRTSDVLVETGDHGATRGGRPSMDREGVIVHGPDAVPTGHVHTLPTEGSDRDTMMPTGATPMSSEYTPGLGLRDTTTTNPKTVLDTAAAPEHQTYDEAFTDKDQGVYGGHNNSAPMTSTGYTTNKVSDTYAGEHYEQGERPSMVQRVKDKVRDVVGGGHKHQDDTTGGPTTNY